jgi:hypothetical protein
MDRHLHSRSAHPSSPQKPSVTGLSNHYGLSLSPALDMFKANEDAFAQPGPSNRASSSGMTIGPIATPDLNRLPALASAASARRPSFALDQISSSPLDTATTETLERQPRLASGYEWDERQHSVNRGQDGTACLSVEPDGDGYLGKFFGILV